MPTYRNAAVVFALISCSGLWTVTRGDEPAAGTSNKDSPALLRAAAAWAVHRSLPPINGKRTAVPAVAFARGSSLLACSNNSGAVIALEPDSGRELWRKSVNGASDMIDVVGSNTLCIASGGYDRPGEMVLLDWKSGEQVGRLGPYEGARNGVSIHQRKPLMAWIAGKDVVLVVDLTTQQLTQHQIANHEKRLTAITWDADSDRLLIASEDGMGSELRMTTAASSTKISLGSKTALTDVTVQHSQGMAAFSSKAGTAHLVRADEPATAMRVAGDYISNIRFSPLAAQVLMVTSRATLYFVDVASGEKLGSVGTNGQTIFGFDISHDGQWMAAGHLDGTVTILRSRANEILSTEAIRDFLEREQRRRK